MQHVLPWVIFAALIWYVVHKIHQAGSWWDRYRTYLDSPAWDELRRRKLREAGYRCEMCGAKSGELNCHHKHYRTLGHESARDLLLVCKPCHQQIHGRYF